MANNNLNRESNQLRGELAHVIRSSQFGARHYQRQLLERQHIYFQQQVLLELINNTNTNLRRRIAEKDLMIERLQDKNRESRVHFKSNLKKVAKHFKIKIQELSDVNERLTIELKDLIDMSLPETHHRRPRSDSSPTESGDEHSLGFPNLFSIPPQTAAVNNGAQNESNSSDEETVASNQI